MSDWLKLLNRSEHPAATANDISVATSLILKMSPSQRKLLLSWLEVLDRYEGVASPERGGPDDR